MAQVEEIHETIFGREELLAAQATYDESLSEQQRKELDANDIFRVALLGRLLVKETEVIVPYSQNGTTLTPDDERISAFNETMALRDKYRTERLRLKIQGNRGSGYWFFAFGFDQHEVGANAGFDEISFFRASMSPISDRLPHSETHTWIRNNRTEELTDVKFKSQEWNFIKSVSGLFMPNVVKLLEGEGQ